MVFPDVSRQCLGRLRTKLAYTPARLLSIDELRELVDDVCIDTRVAPYQVCSWLDALACDLRTYRPCEDTSKGCYSVQSLIGEIDGQLKQLPALV